VHALASSIFSWPGGATWTDVAADLISAGIGGLIVFIWRDHVMRLIVRWWRKHAPAHPMTEAMHAMEDMRDVLHDKLIQVHVQLNELQAHLGNGYLDDVHTKLDEMEQKFRNVVAEDVVPLLTTVEVQQQEE
jgi:hypothetical protein